MIRNITVSGEKRMILRRVIVFGIAAFVLAVLQCAFFSRLKPFGASPDLMLGMICAVMLLDSKRSAAVIAVAGGYLVDALGAVPPSFSPLYYVLAVAIVGLLSEKMMPQFISFAALMVAAVAFDAVCTYITLWISMEALPPIGVFGGVIFPEMLSTFVVCLPIYLLIKLCMLPIGARGRFSL